MGVQKNKLELFLSEILLTYKDLYKACGFEIWERRLLIKLEAEYTKTK